MRTKVSAAPRITREPWGSTSEGDVLRYTLANANGMKVGILTYGGIIQSVDVPDRDGRLANVTLGFDNLADYVEQTRTSAASPAATRAGSRTAGSRWTA